jgi:hypothetical protein
MQPLLVRAAALRGRTVLLDIDSGLAGQQFQRALELQSLDFHHETEHVAALAGAEIMPDLLLRADDETRRLLTGERAQSAPVPPGPLELDVLGHNVLNIQPGFHLFDSVHVISIQQPPLSGKRNGVVTNVYNFGGRSIASLKPFCTNTYCNHDIID